MTEFFDSGIEARSDSGDSVADLLEGHFDAIVLTSSWDSRCLSITAADQVSADLGICALFENRGPAASKHDPQVLAWLGEHNERLVKVEGASENLADIWGQILGPLLALMREKNRPLQVLVDLSTCPRYYAAGLLSSGLERGIISTATFFYAEAAYTEQAEPGRVVKPFTGGRLALGSVPDRMGIYSPTKRRLYMVSVGFEGAETFTAVNRADPDRVALLFPRPGFRPEYEKLCSEQSDQLIEEYLIAPEMIVEAPAGDMVKAWQRLTEYGLENQRPEQENIFYLCCMSPTPWR